MQQRIFIAVKPNDEIAQNIKTLHDEFSHLPVHWVPIENLHITLVPPWTPVALEQEVRKFNKLKLPRPQIITLSKITYFAQKNLLWAVQENSENLGELSANLHKIFDRQPEERVFLTHLTIAKHVAPELKIPDIMINWKFSPASLTLVESIQVKTETKYRIISDVAFV